MMSNRELTWRKVCRLRRPMRRDCMGGGGGGAWGACVCEECGCVRRARGAWGAGTSCASRLVCHGLPPAPNSSKHAHLLWGGVGPSAAVLAPLWAGGLTAVGERVEGGGGGEAADGAAAAAGAGGGRGAHVDRPSCRVLGGPEARVAEHVGRVPVRRGEGGGGGAGGGGREVGGARRAARCVREQSPRLSPLHPTHAALTGRRRLRHTPRGALGR